MKQSKFALYTLFISLMLIGHASMAKVTTAEEKVSYTQNFVQANLQPGVSLVSVDHRIALGGNLYIKTMMSAVTPFTVSYETDVDVVSVTLADSEKRVHEEWFYLVSMTAEEDTNTKLTRLPESAVLLPSAENTVRTLYIFNPKKFLKFLKSVH